jgi:hypothetical protein
MTKTKKSRFDALKVATSLIALTMGAGFGGQASAQSASDIAGTPVPTLDIVANHEVPIGPGGTAVHGSQWGNSPNVLDPLGEVNGVGQQIALVQNGITTPLNPNFPPGTVFLSLCSGTLINPRTVITAAHCVYNNPAHMYGSDTGTGGGLPPTVLGGSQGIPLSFGFASTNRCIGPNAAFPVGNGCTVGTGPYERWRDTNFTSQPGQYIYNANQVWYNTNSLTEFANGDIALITFDTHINNVPTWTLLFSPLARDDHGLWRHRRRPQRHRQPGRHRLSPPLC